MLTALISRLIILGFGTLYPAYASFKAMRNKDVKEYVKWMMYWIVFALFTCVETFADVFLSFWFPLYYEVKVALVFWLLSPATRGSSFLYRNFVHPAFQKRESEIDEMISKAKERGYNTVLSLGSKTVSYATNMLVQTAMRGGGGLMEQIKRSYSLTDLPQNPHAVTRDVPDAHQRPTRPPARGRRVVGSTANLNMRFPEVDVDIRAPPAAHHDIIGDIRSNEDISSGYSSTDQLYTEGVLTRSSSVSSARARGRGSRTTQPRSRVPLSEDTEESDGEYECPMPLGFPDLSHPLSNAPILTDSTISSVSSGASRGLLDPKSPESPLQYASSEVSSLGTHSSIFESLKPHLNSVPPFTDQTGSQVSLVSDQSDTSLDGERKGKYGKKMAPLPPGQIPSTPTPPPTALEPSVPTRPRFPDFFTD